MAPVDGLWVLCVRLCSAVAGIKGLVASAPVGFRNQMVDVGLGVVKIGGWSGAGARGGERRLLVPCCLQVDAGKKSMGGAKRWAQI